MDSSAIRALIIGAIALFISIYLGVAAATAQVETIFWVVSGSTLVVCIALGTRIWLLIPFMGALNIEFLVPGQPNTLLLAQLLVIGFSVLLFLARRIKWNLHITELELWCLLLTLLVLQVYLRNPIGINLFGGSSVGGKAYYLYAITFVSTLLFAGLKVTIKDLKWVLPLSILGGMGNLAVAILGHFVPTFGYYTGTNTMKSLNQGYNDQVVDESAATRIGFLGTFGNNLSLWISSIVSPLKACFHPLWAVLLLTSIIIAGMSGFRNCMASVGMTLLLGIAYRSGIRGLIVSMAGGVMGLAILALTNSLHPLPPNIQRSLAFLPGTWEQRYKDDAKSSTEWRVEIWREVLLTDRWIHNKWLGDGLGFTATELAAQANVRLGARAGISGFDAHREAILANGDYHSGPVSAVRTIGYVGLVILLLAKIRLAVRAHRQILRCKGTEWFSLALLIGIPLIWSPFFFVFIFGGFSLDGASFLAGVGMVRLLENNLPLPAYAKRPRALQLKIPEPKVTRASLA